ncbi:hypothetical protein V5799_026301 [Amblyomma americanum]|uniref:Uncharacterized protein n=1 Tax=Amblyomma americanum TaxID=6943 RepID=A0AAQ4DIZ0_AMBAM
MHHNDEDAEWINVQHRDNSEENLENSYSKDLTFYDECLDSAELAKRIILAESTVQEFIPAIRQTSHHPIHTTVGSIGRFTPCAASEDHWEWLITHYTGHAFNADDPVVIWDNATGLVELLMDDSSLSRDDSRLLVAWTLLRKVLPFASGERMIALAKKKYANQRRRGAIADFCYDTVTDVMALAASKLYFRKCSYRFLCFGRYLI